MKSKALKNGDSMIIVLSTDGTLKRLAMLQTIPDDSTRLFYPMCHKEMIQ